MKNKTIMLTMLAIMTQGQMTFTMGQGSENQGGGRRARLQARMAEWKAKNPNGMQGGQNGQGGRQMTPAQQQKIAAWKQAHASEISEMKNRFGKMQGQGVMGQGMQGNMPNQGGMGEPTNNVRTQAMTQDGKQDCQNGICSEVQIQEIDDQSTAGKVFYPVTPWRWGKGN